MTDGLATAVRHDPVQGSEEIDTGLFVLATLGEQNDDHVLTRSVLNAGLFIPLHRHDDIESIHVVTGCVDVYLGDRRRWFTVAAGNSIVVASGVPHAIRNVSDEPADTLAVVTVRLARFLRELGQMARAADPNRPREERMRSLRHLAGRYGYWMAPAEETEAIRDLPA